MEKYLYFQLTDNDNMNVTVHDLQTCQEIIESHVYQKGFVPVDNVDLIEFTITPIWMTDGEYEALGESENY